METPARFADACGEVPLPEIVGFNIRRLRAIGYLDRFAGSLRELGLTRDDVARLSSALPNEIDRIVLAAGGRAGWLDDPEAHLDGVRCSLLIMVGEDARSTIDADFLDQAALLNRLLDLRHDVRLWVGIDPHLPRSLDTALALLDHPKAAGVALSPFMAGAGLDEDAYAHVLRALSARGTPIWVHGSAHFFRGAPYDIGHPYHLDRALTRFPELRLIIGHAGWPWTADACLVAARHPSVAIEFSTFPPALLLEPGWCLAPLLAQRRMLRDRVFFGSAPATTAARINRLLEQLGSLPLEDDLASWRGEGLRRWLRVEA